MSYAVVRMQKIKSPALKGMQFHHQRERESKTNPDIDESREHLNYDLVNDEKIDFNKRVREIIDSQKISTRKTRKDAVLVNELLITSDREFFDNLSEHDQKQFFEESFELFSERYGKQNIAYATVHNDEKTPHLHLGVVPMRDGRLQGKNVFNRQELRWIQEEFPKHMQSLGFDLKRGEKGSDREHLTMQDFKAKTLENKILSLEENLEKVKDIDKRIQSVDEIDKKAKEVPLLNQVVIKKDDFEAFKEISKAGLVTLEENKVLESKLSDLRASNTSEVQNLSEKLKQAESERNKAMDANERLSVKVDELEHENNFLKRTLEKVKDFYKDNIQFFSRTIGYLKGKALAELYPKDEYMPKKYLGDGDKEEIVGFHVYTKEKQQSKEQEDEHEM